MFILNQENSIANHFLADLRDVDRQKDRLRFRKNLERLGEIMAYEVSKGLSYHSNTIQSPFKEVYLEKITEKPVLISVLRASLPFFQGFLNYLDEVDSGFIGASRMETKNQDPIEIDLNYIAAPSIESKTLILVDPMLATGKSFVKSVRKLLEQSGTPAKIEIVSVIAAPEGIEYIRKNLSIPHRFWICAVDEKLNAKSYIIPGLGDAGDLAFGPKL
ncbi:MAG: uracil phosphoribosyltransferase [Cyclobacteriaceae bacterium]